MTKLGEAEALIGRCAENYDRWVLHPQPIKSLATPAKRKEWEQVIAKSRIALIHEKWDEAQAAARELSDIGGVQEVALLRVKTVLQKNSTWVDGKQVKS